MPDSIGYTFQPGTQRRLLNGVNRGRLGPQANEALRILSLRLPQVLGGSPIAPDDLLRPRVGGSVPGGAVLDSLRVPAALPSRPAPLVTGASAGSPINVARFDSPAALAQLVQGALGPSRPVFTPGTSDPGLTNPDGSRMGPGASVDRSSPTPGNRGTDDPILQLLQRISSGPLTRSV